MDDHFDGYEDANDKIVERQQRKEFLESKPKTLEQKLKHLIPPKLYGKNKYAFNIKHCPGYEGYKPENLDHEVCKFCGSIHYYH